MRLKLPWDLRRGGGQDTDTLSPTLTDGQQFTPSHSTRQPEDIIVVQFKVTESSS